MLLRLIILLTASSLLCSSSALADDAICRLLKKTTILRSMASPYGKAVRTLQKGSIVRMGDKKAIGNVAWQYIHLPHNMSGWVPLSRLGYFDCDLLAKMTKPAKLIGRWTTHPKLGKGHALEFEKKGIYRYHKPTFDMLARMIAHSGKWGVVGDRLFVMTKKEKLYVGGSIKTCDLDFYKGKCLSGGNETQTIVSIPVWRLLGKLIKSGNSVTIQSMGRDYVRR